MRIPAQPSSGRGEITLFLIAPQEGTLWIRKKEDWASAGYGPDLGPAFRDQMTRWLGGRVQARPGDDRTKAPTLLEVGSRQADLEQLLRDTLRVLRDGAQGPAYAGRQGGTDPRTLVPCLVSLSRSSPRFSRPMRMSERGSSRL